MNIPNANLDQLNRRNILKATITAAGCSSLALSTASVASAKNEGFFVNQLPFIELLLSYDVPKDRRVARACGVSNHGLGPDNDRLGLIDDSFISEFNNAEWVVSDGINYSRSPGQLHGNMVNSLTVDTEFHRGNGRAVLLESAFQEPNITLEKSNGGVLKVGTEKSEQMVISPGASDSMNLQEQQVTVLDDQVNSTQKPRKIEIPVTPKIKARNYGEVAVFGKDGYSVVPLSKWDSHLEGIINRNKNKEIIKSGINRSEEFLIIKNGGK